MVKIIKRNKEFYMDGRLSRKLDEYVRKIRQDRDYVYIIDGKEGCLSGDTKININVEGQERNVRLDVLFKNFRKRVDSPIDVRSFNGKSIIWHEILDVVYSGHKKVYQVKLFDGNSIKATGDHKIMTDEGFKRVDKLRSNKDYLMIDDGNSKLSLNNFEKVISVLPIKEKQKTYDIICEEPHHNFSANDIIVHNSGKSVFAMQVAKKLDPNFTVDNIVWSIGDFSKKIMTLPKYSCVMFDEAFRGFSSRATLSTINKKLIQLLMECRQRNLHIILVLPSFFELERYPALHRSELLAHIYERDGQRGYFCLFGNEQKKNLYILGKKFMNYAKPKTKFIGRFTNNYTVDELEYRRLKNDSLRADKKEDKKVKVQKGLLERGRMLYTFIEVKGFSYKQAEELLGLNKTQIQYSLELYKDATKSNIKQQEEELEKSRKIAQEIELEALSSDIALEEKKQKDPLFLED